MTDIELVIKIPEEVYEHILKAKSVPDVLGIDIVNTVNVVKNGTVLPKGHGRIADMDEAIKCIKDVEGDDAIWAISLIEWTCAKRTIIEADKTGSEDKK